MIIMPTISFVGVGTVDTTPNAVNWNNISTSSSNVSTNSQTITGIATPITLRATISSVNIFGSVPEAEYAWTINSSLGSSSVIVDTNYIDVSVSNNDAAQLTFMIVGDPGGTLSFLVTVYNLSDGNAVLDTISIGYTA